MSFCTWNPFGPGTPTDLQLEAAQGGEDKEAKAALAVLKRQTAALAEVEVAAHSKGGEKQPAPDELQIASVLDK